MSFSSKRGRPKKNIEESAKYKDLGTPELRVRKAMSATDEPIDLCLAKGLISEKEHFCALHFRWLYTLRYGLPTVRAIDPSDVQGRDNKNNDEEWRQIREAEFREACDALRSQGLLMPVMSIVVYSEFPLFLSKTHSYVIDIKHIRKEKSLNDLREGLSILKALWK